MEWLKEILTAKGIEVGEELIADVQKGLAKHFVPKKDFNLKLEEIDGLKGQIKTRDDDIVSLKEKANSSDDLTQKLAELQEKYNKDTEDLKQNLSNTQFNSALEIALSKSGAKNTKALKGLLDLEKITFENDELCGFSEQLEQIKEENDFLFSDSSSSGGMRQGKGSPSEDAFMSSVRSAAGLKD